MPEKKVFRAFVRFNDKLKPLYVRAETITLAVKYIQQEKGVTEIINVSDFSEDAIFLF